MCDEFAMCIVYKCYVSKLVDFNVFLHYVKQRNIIKKQTCTH